MFVNKYFSCLQHVPVCQHHHFLSNLSFIYLNKTTKLELKDNIRARESNISFIYLFIKNSNPKRLK